jgi:hypothetical protein
MLFICLWEYLLIATTKKTRGYEMPVLLPWQICVAEPIDCPCPASQMRKCGVGDWYICLEYGRECSDIG